MQLRVVALVAIKTKEGRELQEVSISELLNHAWHIGVAQLLHQRARWAVAIQLVMVTCMVRGSFRLMAHREEAYTSQQGGCMQQHGQLP